MKGRKERKAYEKPAVVFEKDLEALAADCGTGTPNTWVGLDNCKGGPNCVVLYS